MKNAIDLRGCRVLVTGAGGGIGGATAKACLALGAEVVAADLNPPHALAEDACERHGGAVAVELDICDVAAVEGIVTKYGPFDSLADCSGVYLKNDWHDTSGSWEADFLKTMQVNLAGPINLLRASLPGMIEKGKGRIVLTGSVGARGGGSGSDAEPAYLASKGGLHTIVRYFARQVADKGVTVNAVAPGPTLTPMVAAAKRQWPKGVLPMDRVADPSEIAWPMAFLCSPGASYMTGTVIDVNGGTFIG